MDPKTEPNAPDRRPAARWDFLTIVLCAACVALTVLVFLLARQNRALKAQIGAMLEQSVPPQDPNALAIGDSVAPFDAVADSGETTRIEFGAGEARTLLLVYSPDCPACRTNMPVWDRVLASSIPPSVRVLGIRTASAPPQDTSGEEPVPFRSYSLTAPINRLPYVPATVLLDGHGMVLQVWFGVLGDNQEAELRAALHDAAASG